MSGRSGGSSTGGAGGKGNFAITITTKVIGIDQSIAKLTKLSNVLRQTGTAVNSHVNKWMLPSCKLVVL
ncbi:MAG: hypothetical protein L0H53_08740, partial [Candidatus Nitrosocosmicus sp.]|nr:hypothetical protein [Candidatus Nitrosocosmicus sp.]MDN5868402.1 hypothetical protein [Candidatus Nitrosocosmicus sp.]